MSEKIPVSTVTSATDTVPRDYDASTVIEAIRKGGKKLRGQVEEIRATMQRELTAHGDEKRAKRAIDPLKKQIPGVLWSGRFSQRANDKLVSHSGLLCADLDSLNGELSAVRAKLSDSPHLWTLFKSPSGDGLKAVFRVPADQAKHAGSFRAVEQHVKQLTGVQVDQACKDVARLCFLSYDPELILKANAREIEPLPEPEKPRPINNGMVNLSERQRIATGLLGAVDWQSETSGFVACPGKHLHTSGDNDRDCKVELDSAPTIHCFHNSCRGILEGANHTLRSRIGKVERQTASTKIPVLRGGTSNCVAVDEPIELPPAPAPYTAPPLSLLPCELQDYIRAAAESLNVDVSFVLLPLLSSLGSAIGNSRSIQLKRGFVQPPVIWTGIIGRSGSRKSPALEAACFAVMEHERELARQNKTAFEMFQNDLATWETKGRKEGKAKPEQPASLTCLMDDMTLEALGDAMQANPRGLLVKKDELSHWLASFDQYHAAKGADVSRWLSLHTGVFLGLDRRTDHRRYRIHQPRVSLTGGIQPAVLARVLTQDFFERGLPARFLFAAPPARRDYWSENTISERLRERVLNLFSALYELQPEHDEKGEVRPKPLRLDADAKAEFVRYYNGCGDAAMEGDEHQEAAWSKLSGYAARLALVGQVARDPDVEIVTSEVMAAACNLARWFGTEAIRIYATMSETPEQAEQRRLVEFIERRDGAATVRDVMRSLHIETAEQADQTLNALVKAGRGKWVEVHPAGRGRPTRKFQLHRAATVTQIDNLPMKPANCVTVAGGNSQKNTDSREAVEPQDWGEAEPEPEPLAAASCGMTPGGFITEAARLFNATPSVERSNE
jgi:hypothetical protein